MTKISNHMSGKTCYESLIKIQCLDKPNVWKSIMSYVCMYKNGSRALWWSAVFWGEVERKLISTLPGSTSTVRMCGCVRMYCVCSIWTDLKEENHVRVRQGILVHNIMPTNLQAHGPKTWQNDASLHWNTNACDFGSKNHFTNEGLKQLTIR